MSEQDWGGRGAHETANLAATRQLTPFLYTGVGGGQPPRPATCDPPAFKISQGGQAQEVIPKPDTSVTLDDPGRATAVSGKGDSSVVSSPTPVSPHPLKDLSIHSSTQNRGDIDWEAAAVRAAETDRTNQVDPTTAAAIFEPVRKLISAGKEAELKRNSYFAGNCQICGRNHRLCRSVAAKSGDTHDYTPAGARSSTAAEG